MNSSAKKKLERALIDNMESLTIKQIASRYNVSNPYDLIYQLKMDGYYIERYKNVDTNGRVTFKYCEKYPSREVIAAGNRALAAGMFRNR